MAPLARRIACLAVLAALAVVSGPVPATAVVQLPTDFIDQPQAGPLDWPSSLAFLPDGRLLVTELKSGKIRMIVNGALATNDPIGTVDSVAAVFEEEGLYAIAVDPRWPTKPYIYVMLTSLDGFVHIERYAMTGDLANGASGNLTLDNASRRALIRDVQDLNEQHNGGALRVGPDQMLYASFGEDAFACMATDTTKLLGALLRLEVRNLPDSPGAPNKALLVPADNPFAGSPNVNTRLRYAGGLRNPFRFTIDQPTGRVFVADPGWNTYEEIDVVDAPALNFGWPFYEGTMPYVTNECGVPVPPVLEPPAFQYNRTQYCGACGAAIIGGVVLRHVEGSPVSFPASYDGTYIFSDYYEGFLWRIRDSLGTWVKSAPEPGQPNTRDWARGFQQVSDYVLGPDGAVYYARNAVDYNSNTGEVRRIVYAPNPGAVDPRSASGIAFGAVYPLPSRGSAQLSYTLPRAATVRLTVYDAMGRKVKRLVTASELAGEHRVRWDGMDESGRPAAPGVYLARLVVDGQLFDRRIPLVR